MKRSSFARVLVAVTVVAALGTITSTPAHADTCIENTTYTFDPPLMTANRVGTITATWNRPFCVVGLRVSGTKPNISYVGNCLFASTGNGSLASFIVGGSVVFEANSSGNYLKAGVLIPSGNCVTGITSATYMLIRVL